MDVRKKLSLLRYRHGKGFPGGLVVKHLPANAGGTGSVPESGRSPGEGNRNPLQYSCPENLMDRGAWRAIAHGVKKKRHDLAAQQQQETWKNNFMLLVMYLNLSSELASAIKPS